MRRSIVVALTLLPLAAVPARAQIPGIGEAGRLLDRVPSLSSFLEGDPPITTSLDEARTEIAFLDLWSPTTWEPMQGLPRTRDGAFRLRPGRFAMEAQSYCMHAGTHGPGGGDGYLYAPLAGPKAPIVRSILRNSVAHPEIPQRDIQVLIWAIIARSEFDEMPADVQRTARALLSRDQVKDLDKGALGLVPESVMREAMGRLPPLAQQVFQAEARLRSMISSGTSNFAELERVAVLTGAVQPPEGSRPVPDGRWSFDPDGYFVRYDPSGYSRTRVEVSVPRPVAIARDAAGRIAGVYGPHGQRLEIDARGVRLAWRRGDAGETVLGAAPPASGEGGPAAAVLGHVLGSGRVPTDALRELAEIEGLARALRSAGVSVGDGASAPGGAAAGRTARAEALDLLAEAWQSTFCLAAGCPTTPTGGDVLVLRAGTTVRGDLGWCAADFCLLGSTPFERESIEWIGLARANANPPAPVHPDAGEVHRADGSVRVGDLLSVSQEFVLTEAGGHDRLDVAWIHLVASEEEEEAGPPPSAGDTPDGGPPPAGEEEQDEDQSEDPDETDGEFDGPVYDPSDDVATPGNRGRQRLAQSGRPSGDGGDPAPEEDPCAGERRNAYQAAALIDLHVAQMAQLAQQIQEVTGLSAVPAGEYTGPGQSLVYRYQQEIVEHRRLSESYAEAMRLYNECLTRSGRPEVPALNPTP